ncbi:MAG TPA: tetratricopeptide repeat protein [Candidatus Acidoferrum sp.]|nr:tetratricopeptide repeat protein [Candidatus Acidoferrum sp.]
MVWIMGGVSRKKKCCRCSITAALTVLLFALCPLAVPAQNAPPSFDELASEASAASTAGNLPQAIQFYQGALQLKPEWAEGWWHLGLLQYETNAYPSAEESLTHYIELSPNAGPAVALRGLCEFETADYAQSLKDIETGLSLGAATDSRNEQILRYHAALLLTRAGQYQPALQEYAWFARNGISSPELLLGLGLAGLRVPTMPKDIQPDQQPLLAAAGEAAYQFLARHEDQAQKAFDDLFRRFPKAVNAHYLYGYMLLQRDPDHAIDEFKQELQVFPTNADADVMLAWAYLSQNDPQAALPFAQKAFAEGPQVPTAQLVLGRSLVETGQLRAGTDRLEKAAEIDPNNVEIHIALAHAYSEEGRKEDAWRERMLSIQIQTHEANQVAN